MAGTPRAPSMTRATASAVVGGSCQSWRCPVGEPDDPSPVEPRRCLEPVEFDLVHGPVLREQLRELLAKVGLVPVLHARRRASSSWTKPSTSGRPARTV